MKINDNILDYNRFLISIDRYELFNYDKTLNYYGNIPINVEELKCLYDIYKPEMKLLDLGAGIGNVLRFTNNIGYDVTGIEFNPDFEKYLKKFNYSIKDIKELGVSYFKNFDVIYSYKPLKDDFEEYLNMVISGMKSGSYLLTPDFKIKNDKLNEIGEFLYIYK